MDEYRARHQKIPLRDPSEIPSGMGEEEARVFWDSHEVTEEYLEKAGSIDSKDLPPVEVGDREIPMVSTEEIEGLPPRIMGYYDIYFSELRRQLGRSDLLHEAVPDYLKGYKRVVTILGEDGVAVFHYPADTDLTTRGMDGAVQTDSADPEGAISDSYNFVASIDEPVRDIVTNLSDGNDVGLDIKPLVSWGVQGFTAPQQIVDASTGQLVWQAPWTRLVIADSLHLHFWDDTDRAKREAEEDLEPYIRAAGRERLGESSDYESTEEGEVTANDQTLLRVAVTVFE
jgi:hypothetical protein